MQYCRVLYRPATSVRVIHVTVQRVLTTRSQVERVTSASVRKDEPVQTASSLYKIRATQHLVRTEPHAGRTGLPLPVSVWVVTPVDCATGIIPALYRLSRAEMERLAVIQSVASTAACVQSVSLGLFIQISAVFGFSSKTYSQIVFSNRV